MALPPKGDPRRPLLLAIRLTRFLGVTLVVLSAVALLPIFMAVVLGLSIWIVLPQIGKLVLWLAPAIGYLICSYYLRRQRAWAIVVSLVIACLHLLLALAAVAGLAVMIAADWNDSFLALFGAALLLTVVACFAAAFAQLIYHLSKSFEGIKYPPDEQRGFEPVMLQPIPTVAPLPTEPAGGEGGFNEPST